MSGITFAVAIIAVGLCAIWGAPKEWALTAALIGFVTTFALGIGGK